MTAGGKFVVSGQVNIGPVWPVRLWALAQCASRDSRMRGWVTTNAQERVACMWSISGLQIFFDVYVVRRHITDAVHRYSMPKYSALCAYHWHL
jgi:hypothetical protein